MRLTEFFAYINDEIPKGYVPYHLDLSTIKNDKEVKKLKREIKKQKKNSEYEDVDIFG